MTTSLTTPAPTATHADLVERARRLALSCAGVADEADEADHVHPVVRARLADSGLVRTLVPSGYGGDGDGPDALAVTLVREQLASVSSHLDSLFAMQGIGSFALTRAGTPGMRAAWLPRVASLDAVAALALTEPHVGSDLKALSTTVRVDGDELVVDGRKSFITNAGDADYYLVLGREEDGYSLVLVPAATVGLRVDHPHQVMAPHVLGDVTLDQVRVPLDHRVGDVGRGFRHVLDTLATYRVSVAGAAVGTAQAALDEAVRHCTGREGYGAPLIRVGAVGQALALSWTEIEMARSFTYDVARQAALDPGAALARSSMAKVAATETASRVVDRCVQVMGRFGLLRGSTIERLYRAARPMRVYEGATEVLLDSLARQLARRAGS